MNDVWSVYILKCGDGTYYTGISNDVDKRLQKHQKGFGAKYTRGRSPLTMVYNEVIGTRSEASKEEYRIKKLTRIEKIKLIT